MLKITIQSDAVDERSLVSKQGKSLTFRTQEAWAHLAGPFPEKIQIDLYDQRPFPPGDYLVALPTFRVDKYRKLTFGRFVLTPVK